MPGLMISQFSEEAWHHGEELARVGLAGIPARVRCPSHPGDNRPGEPGPVSASQLPRVSRGQLSRVPYMPDATAATRTGGA